ncbi:hypothetical protein SISSUDRAFT_1100579 [Sistotremastrum suecicum HHB10207 ss-3]|uniref:Uncharacterized protein n=1 Tax=Sistotremastrum suecicum HHB10207 ss-3 TaxID=1314776 RepID=A0A165WY14_9AGAM|nr:hypothetical protein SISSUDRAFT_1100579 [Sistotremastrum suecicum HHB10207 ss-3]
MPPNFAQTKQAVFMSVASYQIRWSPFHNRHAVRRGFVTFPFFDVTMDFKEIVCRIRRWVSRTNRRNRAGPQIPILDPTRWDAETFLQTLYTMCRDFFAIFDQTNTAYRAAYRARAVIDEDRAPGAPPRFYGINRPSAPHQRPFSVSPFRQLYTAEPQALHPYCQGNSGLILNHCEERNEGRISRDTVHPRRSLTSREDASREVLADIFVGESARAMGYWETRSCIVVNRLGEHERDGDEGARVELGAQKVILRVNSAGEEGRVRVDAGDLRQTTRWMEDW